MEYQPKYPRYAHQQRALDKADLREAFAYLMKMRTGKTKTVLDEWGTLELRGLSRDLLVIAPAGVYKTWKTDAEKHLSDDLQSRLLLHIFESDDKGARSKKAIEAFLDNRESRPRILLVNVEALSSVDRARKLVIDFLSTAHGAYAVVDESTIIKNPSAERTKWILKHVPARTKYRRILSGLPNPKNALDIWSQFQFLDPVILGYSNFVAFRSRYAIIKHMDFGGRRLAPVVVGFRDLGELQAKIEPHSIIVNLEDTYDMPAKIYQKREVPLTKEQLKAYMEMKEFATTSLSSESHVSATLAITQILKLHQILCGHVKDEDGVIKQIPEHRTKELIKLLNEHDTKAIIWCSYNEDIQKVSAAIEKEFGEGSCARFWGGNINTREEEEARFKREADCRFIVATAAAGGRGRTWDCADLVVYYSNTPDLEHRVQSEERPQAVGKTQSVLYVDLYAPNTVDVRFVQTLRKKLDMASLVTGDKWREWLI
jgi:SNF2 family DNA or RNA helicase